MSQLTQNKRIPELDVLRGLAIFGVLVFHSSFLGRFSKETMEIQTVVSRLFDWAVLAFFFSSGWLHESSISFAVLLKKRILSLLVPFFLYNAIYNICFTFFGTIHLYPTGNPMVNISWLTGFLFHSPGFQLYFLPYLFLISLAAYLLDKLTYPNHRMAYAVTLTLIWIFYLICGYPPFSFGPAYSNLPLYLAAFLLGIVAKPYFDKRIANVWGMMTVLGIVLGILVVSKLPVLSLAVPPLLVGTARGFPKLANSRLLLLMGGMSGSIYLWHTPIMLPGLTRLFASFGLPSLINFAGSLCLTLALCLGLRLGIDRMFEQAFNRPPPRFLTL